MNMQFIEYLPGKKHPMKGADVSDSHESFTDAGLVLSDNDLVVDIDNVPRQTLEKMIEIFNIKTQYVWTDRGLHLYYKKPESFKGAKKVTALGFEVEYKTSKQTKSVTIKRDGVLREIINTGVREDVPPYLYSHKRFESLLGLSENDGRNQKLFAHRMKISYLQNWKSIARFINNHVFAEPLDNDEFDTICRDVKITAVKDGESVVAEQLMTKYKVVSYLGRMYYYHEDQYKSDIDVLRRIVFAEIGDQKTRYVDEVIKQMEYRSTMIGDDKVFDIKLGNGILRDGKFIEVDYTEFTPYTIEIDYNPNAEPVEKVDEYLKHLTNNDDSYRDLLLETMAHSLIVNKEFKRAMGKFFIFVGNGNNGKSTVLQVLRTIFGAKNCTGLSMANLKDERYLTTMQGKLCNLGDDLSDIPIDSEIIKQLKNISTCDFISVRDLFKQSREVELTTSLIFTSNHILKSFEKGDSFKRRIIWMPMYAKPTKKDPKFITNITTPEALEYWMKLMVEAYMRMYENGEFTFSQAVYDFNNSYHQENNSALEYLQDYTVDDFLHRRSPECYEQYEIWCEENGLNILSKKQFNSTIQDTLGLKLGVKKLNGKTARVYMN